MRNLGEKTDEKKAAPAESEREQLEEVKKELSRINRTIIFSRILCAIVIAGLWFSVRHLDVRISRLSGDVAQFAEAVARWGTAVADGNAMETDILQQLVVALQQLVVTLQQLLNMMI